MQTIAFQDPYLNYSLEELRLADYDRGRRYRSSSNEFAQSSDSRSAEVNRIDDSDDEPSVALRPGTGGLFYRTDDDAGSTYSSELITPTDSRNYYVEDAFAKPDDGYDDYNNDDDEEDDEDDTSSDTSRSSSSARIRTPISGDRLIELPTLKRMISDLETWQQKRIMRVFDTYRNPNGTYSVPLTVVVRSINRFLKPADRIF
ncbi:hypothetical protein N0V94_003389 [Neodidymelliopsis sp. IMI 364377]|nr:hypothetical protein N0V94_003389 [Neodidymelliopsis sp. IMI 364377]